MQAGRLRHKLVIQQNTQTRSATGEALDSWSTLTTVWGGIQPASGRELIRGDQQVGEISHIITIRKNTSVSEVHRISWASPEGTRIFDIKAVIRPREVQHYIELACVETK